MTKKLITHITRENVIKGTTEEPPVSLKPEFTGQIFIGSSNRVFLGDINYNTWVEAINDNIFGNKVALLQTDIDQRRDKSVKITKDDLDTSHDSKKIGLKNLSNEVLQAMTGNTSVNANIDDGSIVNEKYADESITPNKLNNSTFEKLDERSRVQHYNSQLDDSLGVHNFRNLLEGTELGILNPQIGLDNISSSYKGWKPNTKNYVFSEELCKYYYLYPCHGYGTGLLTYCGFTHTNPTELTGNQQYGIRFWINLDDLKSAITKNKTTNGRFQFLVNLDTANGVTGSIILDFSQDLLDVPGSTVRKTDTKTLDSDTYTFDLTAELTTIYNNWGCYTLNLNTDYPHFRVIPYLRAFGMKERQDVRLLGMTLLRGAIPQPHVIYSEKSDRRPVYYSTLESVVNNTLYASKKATAEAPNINNVAKPLYTGNIPSNTDLNFISLNHIKSETETIYDISLLPYTTQWVCNYKPLTERNCLMYMGIPITLKEGLKQTISTGVWINKEDLAKLPSHWSFDSVVVYECDGPKVTLRDLKQGLVATRSNVGEKSKNKYKWTASCPVELEDWVYYKVKIEIEQATPNNKLNYKVYWRLTDSVGQPVEPFALSLRFKAFTLIESDDISPFDLYGVTPNSNLATKEELSNHVTNINNRIEEVSNEVITVDQALHNKMIAHEKRYHAPISMEAEHLNAIKHLYVQYPETVPSQHFNTSHKPGSTIEYCANKDVYNSLGINNTVKISRIADSNTYTPELDVLATVEDLARIGIIPNDENPPLVNLRGMFWRPTIDNMKYNSLQIWFAIRYGDSQGGPGYSTGVDVTFINSNTKANHLGANDTFWVNTSNRSAKKIETDEVLCYIQEGIPVPATYKGKPLQGIYIRYIGYKDSTMLGRESSFETLLTAVTKGDTPMETYNPYLNIPMDFTWDTPTLSTDEEEDTNGGVVNIANADKVVMIGDSFTACHYTLPGKAYIHNLSMFSDWNFENFARSGDDYGEMNQRILQRKPEFHSTLSIDKYGGTYAVLLSNENDGYLKGRDHHYYYDNLEKLITSVKSLGLKPIVCTEFSNGKTDHRLVRGLKTMADKHGARFIDIATGTKITNNNKYLPFWGSGHPATRTTYLFSDGINRELERLPRPKKSLKIFRKRNTVNVNSIDDLLIRNNVERAEKFKEILIGHYALRQESKAYYDALDVKMTNEKQISEYLKLQNNENVNFGDYALVEVVVPSTAKDIKCLQLSLSGNIDGLQVFYKDMIPKVIADFYTKHTAFTCSSDISTVNVGDQYSDGQTTFTVAQIKGNVLLCNPLNSNAIVGTLTKVSGNGVASITTTARGSDLHQSWYDQYPKPQYQWSPLKLVGGMGTISDKETINRCVEYDKVTFLLYREGGFTLNDIKLKWTGNEAKLVDHVGEEAIHYSRNEELLPTTTFENGITQFTKGGTFNDPYVPADKVLPYGASKCIDLPVGNYLHKNITVGSVEEYTRTLQVKVYARVFPTIHPYANGYDGVNSPITEDTYDLGDLKLTTYEGNSNSNSSHPSFTTKQVGLHWKEVIFNVPISTFMETMSIKLEATSKTLQIAKVSVKIDD